MRRILTSALVPLSLAFLAAPAFASDAPASVRVKLASTPHDASLLMRAARAIEATPGVSGVEVDLARFEVRGSIESDETALAIVEHLTDAGLTARAERRASVASR